MERSPPLRNAVHRSETGRTDCGTALRHILTGCVQTLERQRSAAADGNAVAVHQMRIELTRLTSALLFFSPILTDPEWDSIASRVRSLNSRLGRARDQDVILQYSSRRRYRRWARSSLLSIKRARAKRYRKLGAELCSDDYQRLLRDIDRQTQGLVRPVDDERDTADLALFAETQLLTWRSEIERLGRHLKKLSERQQHCLRLKCKYYRYVVDLLLDLGGQLGFPRFAFPRECKAGPCTIGRLARLETVQKRRAWTTARLSSQEKEAIECCGRRAASSSLNELVGSRTLVSDPQSGHQPPG